MPLKTLTSFLAAVVLLTGTPSATAQSFRERVERGFRSVHYFQDTLRLTDPEGDAHIIRRLDTIPVQLLSLMANRSLPQAVSEKERLKEDLRNSRETGEEPFRIGKTNPLDTDLLLGRFCAIMHRHYPDITPSLGQEHEWSPEARQYLHYGFWHRLWRRISRRQKDFPVPLLHCSKLLVCLACGWTSYYCVTGQEEALTERILHYPDGGVQLENLFEESYVLNGGNLYLTFLTCENILARYPHRGDRGNDTLQKKLAYIRNDSKPLGDNYGAWYHFYGIALYGMVRNSFTSRLVADTESFGSLFLEGPDRQEYYINKYGALFGHRLKKRVREGIW